MVQAILFDLDGTLVDTAPEIADAVNLTLARQGLPPASVQQVLGWIGDGTRELLARALRAGGVVPAALPTVLQAAWPGFELDYADCCGRNSRPYAGVPRMLERLAGAGVKLGLVTNKEAAFAHRLLVRHALSECFDLLVCGDTLPVRKPDPGMLRHALHGLGCTAEDALFIGDSVQDARCARAAGVAFWAVSHGYGGVLRGDDAPDRTLDSFDELTGTLTNLRGLRVSIA